MLATLMLTLRVLLFCCARSINNCEDSTAHCIPRSGHQTFGKSFGESVYRGDGSSAEIGSGFLE